jgi:hypothetical protein
MSWKIEWPRGFLGRSTEHAGNAILASRKPLNHYNSQYLDLDSETGEMERRACLSHSRAVGMLAVISVLMLAFQGCGPGGQAIKRVTLEPGGMQEIFSLYYPVPFDASGHLSAQPASNLSGVANMSDFSLPPEALSMLSQQGFVLMKGNDEQMAEAYRKIQGPKFITLDSAAYAFRVLGDYALLAVELKSLNEDLKDLVSALFSSLQGIYEGNQGSVREAALTDLGFIGVAARLLGSRAQVPQPVAEAVDKEMALIAGHSGSAVSPLWGSKEDYSLYAPFGHYDDGGELESYYQALTWLQEADFAPRPGPSPSEIERGHKATRQALLLVAALQQNDRKAQQAMKLWDEIYQVEGFLSGVPGPLNVYSYNRLAAGQFGRELELSRLADDSQIEAFTASVLEEASFSGTDSQGGNPDLAFHLFAPRPDVSSRIFAQLVDPAVPERKMPRILDVPSAYGSDRAFNILDKLYKDTKYESYADNVRKLGKEAYLNPLQTHSCMYLAGMDASRALLKPPAAGYPGFMQSNAWQDRDLFSYLGQWVLLEKQSVSWKIMDIPAPDAVVPSTSTIPGYVEPRPEAFALLAAATDTLQRGFSERGLAIKDVNDRLAALNQILLALKVMAEKELRGQPLSAEDNGVIANFGNTLKYLTTAPVPGDPQRSQTPATGPVADLYVDSFNQQTLQAGLGRPTVCYVIAWADGKPTLLRGAGFSCYEAVKATEQKYDDSTWAAYFDSGQAPDLPAWTATFFK